MTFHPPTQISRRDLAWAAVLLLCVLYFYVLHLSRCPWVDGPFAFVRGCHNGGIDWNAFMAPIGMVVMFALPMSVVYWVLRGLQILSRGIWRGFRRMTGTSVEHPSPESPPFRAGPLTLISAFVVLGAPSLWLGTLAVSFLSPTWGVPVLPAGVAMGLVAGTLGVRHWRACVSRDAARQLHLAAILVASMALLIFGTSAQLLRSPCP